MSLENMNAEDLKKCEDYANNNLQNTIENLKCCYSDVYQMDVRNKQFEFISEHKDIILNLSNQSGTSSETHSQFSLDQLHQMSEIVANNPAFSNVMKELIQTAITNYEKSPNLYRYSDILKYFATYVYLLCGRQCYEVLSNNLPMPAASTISKKMKRILCFCFNNFYIQYFSKVHRSIKAKSDRRHTQKHRAQGLFAQNRSSKCCVALRRWKWDRQKSCL